VGHKGANEQLGFQSPPQWQGYIKKERDGKFEYNLIRNNNMPQNRGGMSFLQSY
jgi:hypothetical protein